MNSIRPLVTITVLVVVGAFLYVKINERPDRPTTVGNDPWPHSAPHDVPPPSVTAAAAPQPTSAAPPWPANSQPAALSADAVSTGQAPPVAQQPSPAVPEIPEMPTVASTPQEAAPPIASVPTPQLPATIPTASYPDPPGGNQELTPIGGAIATTSPAAEADRDAAATAAAPAPQQPQSPEQANSIDVAASSVSSAPLTAQQNPLRDPSQSLPAERYGASSVPSVAAVQPPAAEAQSSFATEWPAIQATLERGEYAAAHQQLSRWYNDPTLTPTDAEMVESLLSQLAGTVVYSTEHQLEPAHVVKPGETLETIAKELNVPWQLLAKINGIAAADNVQPGQALKVVRGPFSAVVDLGRKQLTLMVGDRYAGKFPITVPSMAAVGEGQWRVAQKLVAPSGGVVQSAYAPASPAVDRAIVLRSDAAPGQASGEGTLTIASVAQPGKGPAGSAAIQVAPQDAEELSDILSVGSRVVIQR
jgi:LysM repeat protein